MLASIARAIKKGVVEDIPADSTDVDPPRAILKAYVATSVECCICLTDYDPAISERRPLALPCGHSICRDCMPKLHIKKCPACRWNLQFEAPPNYALIELLEKRVEVTADVDDVIKAAHDTLVRERDIAESKLTAANVQGTALQTELNQLRAASKASKVEIRYLKAQISDVTGSLAWSESEKAMLSGKLKNVEETYNHYSRQIRTLEDIITTAKSDYRKAESEVVKLRERIALSDQKRIELQAALSTAEYNYRVLRDGYEEFEDCFGLSAEEAHSLYNRLSSTIGELRNDLSRVMYERDRYQRESVGKGSYLIQGRRVVNTNLPLCTRSRNDIPARMNPADAGPSEGASAENNDRAAESMMLLALSDDQVPPECYPLKILQMDGADYTRLVTIDKLAVLGREYNDLLRSHTTVLSDNKTLRAQVAALEKMAASRPARTARPLNTCSQCQALQCVCKCGKCHSKREIRRVITDRDDSYICGACVRCKCGARFAEGEIGWVWPHHGQFICGSCAPYERTTTAKYVYSVLLRLRSLKLEKLLGEGAQLHDDVDALIETASYEEALIFYNKEVKERRESLPSEIWKTISLQIVCVRLGEEIIEGKINQGRDPHGRMLPSTYF